MNSDVAIDLIKRKFSETGSPANIPLLRGGAFMAEIDDHGVWVDNLGNQPFMEWKAFREAVAVLIRNGGRARRGNAMMAKLGEEELSLDSVEGYVAFKVYGKKIGETVFRRISPISAILVWAGVCEYSPGELILIE